MDQPEDDVLIARCRAGDLSAYRLLFDRYEQPMLRMGMGMLGGREDAEDAVQETFLKLHRSLDRIVPGAEGRVRAYLFRILRNTCLDILRQKRGKAAADVDVESLPGRARPEERLTLEAALDSLPPRMKSCFVLAAVEQLKYDEIAQVMGLRLGTVKATVHQARGRLKSFLAPQGAGWEAGS